jgi:hypothetical protein
MTEGEGRAQESESARQNMCTGSGFIFIDGVDRKIRVHVRVNELSTGTRFVQVLVDRGEQPKQVVWMPSIGLGVGGIPAAYVDCGLKDTKVLDWLR